MKKRTEKNQNFESVKIRAGPKLLGRLGAAGIPLRRHFYKAAALGHRQARLPPKWRLLGLYTLGQLQRVYDEQVQQPEY